MDLDESQVHQLAELLSKLSPGYYPEAIFQEFSRLTVSPIIEVVPLRINGGDVEVLLLARDADDPIWPNQLHTPGTGVRPTDTVGSFADALKRVLVDELRGIKTTEPHFVTSILHHSGRGMEASQTFWVEILEEPEEGTFYKADDLPRQLVQSQMDFIPLVVENYKGSHTVKTRQ